MSWHSELYTRHAPRQGAEAGMLRGKGARSNSLGRFYKVSWLTHDPPWHPEASVLFSHVFPLTVIMFVPKRANGRMLKLTALEISSEVAIGQGSDAPTEDLTPGQGIDGMGISPNILRATGEPCKGEI